MYKAGRNYIDFLYNSPILSKGIIEIISVGSVIYNRVVLYKSDIEMYLNENEREDLLKNI